MQSMSSNATSQFVKLGTKQAPNKMSKNFIPTKIMKIFRGSSTIILKHPMKWTHFEQLIIRENSLSNRIHMLEKGVEYLKYRIKTKVSFQNSNCNTDILYIYWYSRSELERMEEICRNFKRLFQSS